MDQRAYMRVAGGLCAGALLPADAQDRKPGKDDEASALPAVAFSALFALSALLAIVVGGI